MGNGMTTREGSAPWQYGRAFLVCFHLVVNERVTVTNRFDSPANLGSSIAEISS